MSCKFSAADGSGSAARASAIRTSSSLASNASAGSVAGSTGPRCASGGRCERIFGGWIGTNCFLLAATPTYKAFDVHRQSARNESAYTQSLGQRELYAGGEGRARTSRPAPRGAR